MLSEGAVSLERELVQQASLGPNSIFGQPTLRDHAKAKKKRTRLIQINATWPTFAQFNGTISLQRIPAMLVNLTERE